MLKLDERTVYQAAHAVVRNAEPEMLDEIRQKDTPVGAAVRELLERHGSREGVIRARARKYPVDTCDHGTHVGNVMPTGVRGR